MPLVTIYMLAAIQSIPQDLYEAAWTDGAGRFYRFRRITLPLMVPALITMSMLSLIATFNSFDIIWILTQGGPSGETTTMIIDTYQTAIGSKKYGEGAARAVLICIFLSIFCLAYFRVTSRLSDRGDNAHEHPAKPMIDRYRWYELIGIYARHPALFLTFVLAPFVEGFLVSLKPLSQLFSSPYASFRKTARSRPTRTMWVSVPGFARYIFNSLLHLDHRDRRSC